MCDETVMKVNSRYKVHIIRMVRSVVQNVPGCACVTFLLTECL